MKKKAVRWLSIMLVIVMVFTFNISAFASTDNLESITEKQIQAKVEEQMEKTLGDVYLQLEEQGRIDHYDEYVEILSSEIDASVRAQYSSSNSTRAGGAYIPYGGAVKYKTKQDVAVLTTYLDKDNTYYYILSSNSVKAKIVIETILGFFPNWGTPFSLLAALKTICSSSGCSSVLNAGGKGYILSMQTSDGTKSTVLLGWTNYPYAGTVSNASTTVVTKAFSKYDPFE